MYKVLITTFFCIAVAVPYTTYAQQDEKPKQEEKEKKDVLQLKSGSILIGKITKVEQDAITIELDKGGSTTLQVTDIEPYTVYKVRAARIDDKNAKQHLELGDFCFGNKLFLAASQEYNKALELDPSLKDTIQKKLEEVNASDAKQLFEDGITLVKQDNLEEAVKKFRTILDKYQDSSFANQAKEELSKLTAIIKDRSEQKLKQLEEAKKKMAEQKAKESESKVKFIFDGGLKSIEEGKTFNANGLNAEAKGNITAADNGYKQAETSLLNAKRNLDGVLSTTKDVDIIDATKDKVKEAENMLVTVYDNLGNLWALQDNFTEATKWLNKALAIDPHDKVATELKLAITQARIRLRTGR